MWSIKSRQTENLLQCSSNIDDMKLYVLLIFLVCSTNAQDTFPDNFRFGVGSAAYQIEGAWNTNQKGENIWDALTHFNPEFVIDGTNGDIACDSYNKLESDVQLIKNMSVDFYRFSLSWSRLFPTGHTYKRNEDGFNYYNRLIAELKANDIEPFVTIYHWDLPQPLLEIGGWTNPIMADYYADFADKIFLHFGDEVKNWITFNEPYQICEQGFSDGTLAPGYRQMGIGGYLCGHTVLRAHAKTYQLYQDKYKSSQGGVVGITVNGVWAEPLSESDEDQASADLYMSMNFAWFLDPIFGNGDYPANMKQAIDDLSVSQGFKRSRLPEFTPEEKEMLRDSADFLGLNHYGSVHCRRIEDVNVYEAPSHTLDSGVECHFNEEWGETAAPWYVTNPEGFRKILNWIKDRYGNPEVIITENGYADNEDELRDCGRVNYHNEYLEQLLVAIYEDECKVTAYTAWSVFDLFEWEYGHTYTFGMYRVDHLDAARPRTPKMSSYVYKNIIETRSIDQSYAPEGYEKCTVESNRLKPHSKQGPGECIVGWPCKPTMVNSDGSYVIVNNDGRVIYKTPEIGVLSRFVMMLIKALFSIFLLVCLTEAQDRQFPVDFKFGVATSSYQVEGAWNISEKGANIWDHLTHTSPNYVVDGSNGDDACNAYYKTTEDVQLLNELGVDFYRFSISWSRIFPTGHTYYMNDDGVRYYNELIEELVANDIIPIVTMFHWDLPLALHEIGGWTNPLLADYFVDYARKLFEMFGDRVKYWITFNEPYEFCQQGYSTGGLAPAYLQDGYGGYLCGRTVLLAHARTFKLFNEVFRPTVT
ncbi:hypothetical protein Trydic_g11867, partial [Trypoxylus dichotomus]